MPGEIETVEELEKALLERAEEAIPQIQDVIDKRSQKEYGDDEGVVKAYCDGPHEGVFLPVYNAVGSAYSSLSRDEKDRALKQVIGKMDGKKIYHCSKHTHPWN